METDVTMTDTFLLPPIRNDSLYPIPLFSSSAGQCPLPGGMHPGFGRELADTLGSGVWYKLSYIGMEEQKPRENEKYFQGNTEVWPFSW